MSSILNIKRNFTLVVDDFFDRPEYASIETTLGQPKRAVNNAAIFDVKINKVNLSEVVLQLKLHSLDSR